MSEITLRTCSTAKVTSVASSATSVPLLAANSVRRGGSIMNNSTAILYVLMGDAAGTQANATTSNSVQMASNTYFEIPAGFTGAISGIWASANGSANMTEYV